MKAFISNAVLGLALATVSVAGCANSTGGNLPGTENIGSVGMKLTLPGGLQLNSVSYKILSGTTVVAQGTVNVSNSSEIAFTIGGLPSGSYTVTVTGVTTDGSSTCIGSAPFAVTQQATTTVTVQLTCTTPAQDAGSVTVIGQISECATWQSVSVLPAQTTIGNAVAVNATATGPNTAGLTYSWTAPSGTFSAATSASTNFTCTVPGAVVLTLVVGDGSVGPGVTCAPQDTTTVTVQCASSGSSSSSSSPSSSSSSTSSTSSTSSSSSSTSSTSSSSSSSTSSSSSSSTSSSSSSSTSSSSSSSSSSAGPQAACNAYLAANQASLENVTNVCSGTELALWNQDGNGTCLAAAFDQGALDDTSGSDSNKECEDLPATVDPTSGLTYRQLCLNELECELGEGTGLSTTTPPASGGVPNAFCGTSTSCSTAPTGLCVAQFEAAYLGAAPAKITTEFGAGCTGASCASAIPGGQANALIATLVTSHSCNEN